MLGTVHENRMEYEEALELYKQGYSRLSDNMPNKKNYYNSIMRMRRLINNK